MMHHVPRANDGIDLSIVEGRGKVFGNGNTLITSVSLKGDGRFRDGSNANAKEIGRAWMQK